MKDCVTKETSANSGMSKSDARKTCRSQLKAQSDQSSNSTSSTNSDRYDDASSPGNMGKPSNSNSSTTGPQR